MKGGDGRYIVMGVSGCGKSTIGAALARRLDLDFVDGDMLHPAANIQKMTRQQALDDTDRAPWLDRVAGRLSPGTIIACSALKRAYRDRIRAGAGGPVTFIYLCGTADTLTSRMNGRNGHFMPPALLASQLGTLEEPSEDENAIRADIEADPARIVDLLTAQLVDRPTPGTRSRG